MRYKVSRQCIGYFDLICTTIDDLHHFLRNLLTERNNRHDRKYFRVARRFLPVASLSAGFAMTADSLDSGCQVCNLTGFLESHNCWKRLVSASVACWAWAEPVLVLVDKRAVGQNSHLVLAGLPDLAHLDSFRPAVVRQAVAHRRGWLARD